MTAEGATATGTYPALCAAVVFWGLSFVATKLALESLPVFTLVFARFGIAALFFALWIWRRGGLTVARRDHLRLLAIAVFEPGLYFLFETFGLQYTSAPKTALIIATIPVVVLVMGALLLGERVGGLKLAGVLMSLAGIALLVAGDPAFEWNLGGSLRGDLLVVGAVFSAAFYMLLVRGLGNRYSAAEITALQTIYGALLFLPPFLWEAPGVRWAAVSGPSLAALAYLVIFATVAAFLCYNYALTRIPASRAAVFINGIPVVTAAGAWLLLGETLTGTQAAGGGVVLVAVVMANLPAGRRRVRAV